MRTGISGHRSVDCRWHRISAWLLFGLERIAAAVLAGPLRAATMVKSFFDELLQGSSICGKRFRCCRARKQKKNFPAFWIKNVSPPYHVWDAMDGGSLGQGSNACYRGNATGMSFWA